MMVLLVVLANIPYFFGFRNSLDVLLLFGLRCLLVLNGAGNDQINWAWRNGLRQGLFLRGRLRWQEFIRAM